MVRDEDFVLAESIQNIDNLHIRRDYIIHPKSAMKRAWDGRLIIEAVKAERLDDITNLYFNPQWARAFFDEIPQRFLTEDGHDLFFVRGHEMLEAFSEPYKQCKTCHETMPLYWEMQNGGRPSINGYHPIRVGEVRTFMLKTPLQAMLKNSGMVITQVDHPCYHSLQEILRPNVKTALIDPPKLTPVFPKDIKY